MPALPLCDRFCHVRMLLDRFARAGVVACARSRSPRPGSTKPHAQVGELASRSSGGLRAGYLVDGLWVARDGPWVAVITPTGITRRRREANSPFGMKDLLNAAGDGFSLRLAAGSGVQHLSGIRGTEMRLIPGLVNRHHVVMVICAQRCGRVRLFATARWSTGTGASAPASHVPAMGSRQESPEPRDVGSPSQA
jgi:hypothetical protein